MNCPICTSGLIHHDGRSCPCPICRPHPKHKPTVHERWEHLRPGVDFAAWLDAIDWTLKTAKEAS